MLKSDRFIQVEEVFYFFTFEDSNLVIVKDIPGYGDFYSPFNKVDFSEYEEPLKSKMEQCKNIIIPYQPLNRADIDINNKNFVRYLKCK